jgi:hypothetical protein
MKPARKLGLIDKFRLPEDIRDNLFAVSIYGYIKIETGGVYTFYTSSDDGSVLLIGNKIVVDNDGFHTEEQKAGQIALAKGFHPIKAAMFEDHGDQVLEVYYQGPGIDKMEIPPEVLFYEKY